MVASSPEDADRGLPFWSRGSAWLQSARSERRARHSRKDRPALRSIRSTQAMHVGLPEPNGTGSIWMISKLVTIAGRTLCSSVSGAIWTNSTLSRAGESHAGSPTRINLVPMARGELPPATGVICGSEVRPPRTVHDVRLVRRKHPGTTVEARSNYRRLLQQVHIPGDAMEGTTADQSVWLGEDRSPPAERHFEAAAAGIRR